MNMLEERQRELNLKASLGELMSVARDAEVYLVDRGAHVAQLPFAEAERRRKGYLIFLGRGASAAVRHRAIGSQKHWDDLRYAYLHAETFARSTGKRCSIMLHPMLIGREGCRVEVTNAKGERSKFIVGKTSGWCPCHRAYRKADADRGEPIDPTETLVNVRLLEANVRPAEAYN